ncbi:hypothetical protein CYMTET_56604 [Cymbomonas tetramitiformis]|uniref:Uncharacterized protein n=1 Tax=Cymbomonas tetramitiformis TaxID=36881 RepID=A0AAE0ELT0_9CHLO|nr:hypothetical protein CYMTET_56604 [Cymbomonas tetramitiformis]
MWGTVISLLVWSVVLCPLAVGRATAVSHIKNGSSHNGCEMHTTLFSTIHEDLAVWAESGITKDLMQVPSPQIPMYLRADIVVAC